ncbi:hypothetical protein MG293_000764 [Ovis ammon polii]|uniref:HMG box domain-containing protein n=1 Tax=Ovis ammon polii TaxID=230172 RepID=A0AAD4UQJ4_OVIAM|nr:hypothetical protein MG293_000764 [Ovis ammon polii]
MGKGDPNKPRGKMSSYAFFVQTCREEHKKKHHDSSVNFAVFQEMFREMEDHDQGTFEADYLKCGSSLVAQMVKLLPTMWETWVPSLGREDPLEKEMAIHSCILTWKISWTEEPG